MAKNQPKKDIAVRWEEAYQEQQQRLMPTSEHGVTMINMPSATSNQNLSHQFHATTLGGVEQGELFSDADMAEGKARMLDPNRKLRTKQDPATGAWKDRKDIR